MKWTEGVNCKTQCGAIPHCDMTESRSSSIDSDDITVAKTISDNSDICGDDDERDVWCI